jgi:hypothetical protein
MLFQDPDIFHDQNAVDHINRHVCVVCLVRSVFLVNLVYLVRLHAGNFHLFLHQQTDK